MSQNNTKFDSVLKELSFSKRVLSNREQDTNMKQGSVLQSPVDFTLNLKLSSVNDD